jgi:hypothetical protein
MSRAPFESAQGRECTASDKADKGLDAEVKQRHEAHSYCFLGVPAGDGRVAVARERDAQAVTLSGARGCLGTVGSANLPPKRLHRIVIDARWRRMGFPLWGYRVLEGAPRKGESKGGNQGGGGAARPVPSGPQRVGRGMKGGCASRFSGKHADPP